MNNKRTYRNISKSEDLSEFDSGFPNVQIMGGQQKEIRFFTSTECKSGNTIPYRRRDFYKVSLLRGEYIIHYMDESIKVSGTSLSFFSPRVPYTIEELKEEENAGYFIFTEASYDNFFVKGINSFPLFNTAFKPIFLLSKAEKPSVLSMFNAIEKCYFSDYALKNELFLNKVNELLHLANQFHPSYQKSDKFTSQERLHNIFTELLERQFPVGGHSGKILRSPNEFAEALHIHINYLNRILKNLTGKTTSEHIRGRLLKESLILLKHTDSSISEIAYELGFKDVSHFNHFFRKETNATPSGYRNQNGLP
ncbi:helix-turn-helix domain-containing protein [Sinomicrobium sp. M5D2P9]